MTTAVTLARGRLRLVPWGWLTVLATGWSLATRILTGFLASPSSAWSCFGGQRFCSDWVRPSRPPENDQPWELLRATPLPLWRTLALGLAGWLLLGAAPVVALAVGRGGSAGWATTDLGRGTAEPAARDRGRFLTAMVTSTMGGGRGHRRDRLPISRPLSLVRGPGRVHADGSDPSRRASMRRITRRTELSIGVGIVAAGALLAFVVPAVIAVGPSRGIGYATMVIGVLVVIGLLLPPRRVQGTKLWEKDRYPGSTDDAVLLW